MFAVRAKTIFESVKIAKPTENHTDMEPDINLGRAVAGSPWVTHVVDLARVVASFGRAA